MPDCSFVLSERRAKTRIIWSLLLRGTVLHPTHTRFSTSSGYQVLLAGTFPDFSLLSLAGYRSASECSCFLRHLHCPFSAQRKQEYLIRYQHTDRIAISTSQNNDLSDQTPTLSDGIKRYGLYVVSYARAAALVCDIWKFRFGQREVRSFVSRIIFYFLFTNRPTQESRALRLIYVVTFANTVILPLIRYSSQT